RDPPASLHPPRPKEPDDDLFREEPVGPLELPGKYKAVLSKRVGGVETPLAEPVDFQVTLDGGAYASLDDLKALREFQVKALRLERALAGTLQAANDLTGRLDQIKQALEVEPSEDKAGKEAVRKLEQRNRDILRALRGDVVLRGRNENTPMSALER